MVIFNEKQALALTLLHKFIKQTKHKIFYLLGYAGTGKTFLISHALHQMLSKKLINKTLVCSPTHKALNVIESYMKQSSYSDPDILSKISFMTVHKLLEFRPVIITKDGSQIFKAVAESKFLKQICNQLIVIDECSMITKEMIKELHKYINLYAIRILFLGDPKQLAPINETESVIFQNIRPKYRYHITLDEIMRTDSINIKEVATLIRKWNGLDSLGKLLVPIYKADNKKLFRIYRKQKNTWFKHFIKKLNTDAMPIILTWRNISSNTHNRLIREHIHHKAKTKLDLSDYLVGDHVVFNNYYVNPDKTNFYTSDVVKITKITYEKRKLFDWSTALLQTSKTNADMLFNKLLQKLALIEDQFNICCLTVNRINTTDEPIVIYTISKPDLAKYYEQLNSIQEHIEHFYQQSRSDIHADKLWKIYHKEIIGVYADIDFGYSLTVHKSQGSTFDIVIIDVADINDNVDTNEFAKLFYTGATRAARELWLLLA